MNRLAQMGSVRGGWLIRCLLVYILYDTIFGKRHEKAFYYLRLFLNANCTQHGTSIKFYEYQLHLLPNGRYVNKYLPV